MGKQRQQLAIGGKLLQINNASQVKMYFIWGLGLLIPFLVLFCIFPSGAITPYHHIVIGQLQGPSLRAQSSRDGTRHEEFGGKPSTSSFDDPGLAANRAKAHGDGKKKTKKQTDDVSSIDSLASSTNAKKQTTKEPSIKVLIDKELDEQTMIQTKKSSRKGKIKHRTEKISAEMARDEEFSISGKGDANQDDYLHEAKSKSVRKPLGEESSANEEDPIRHRSGSSKPSSTRRPGREISSSGKVIRTKAEDPTEIDANEEYPIGINSKPSRSRSHISSSSKPFSTRRPGREISSSGKAIRKKGDDPIEISANEEYPMSHRSSSSKPSATRKPGREISSSGKEIKEEEEDPVEISANEEDPIIPWSTRKEEDPVDDAEEGISFSTKQERLIRKDNFPKAAKRGSRAHAVEEKDASADLLFWEDARALDDLLEQQRSQGEESGGGEDDSRDDTSHIVAKVLVSNPKRSEKCKYYKGKWIIDSNDNAILDSTCTWMFMNDDQECEVINKSTNPIKWRWQPTDCNMERFKTKSFLKLMQRKSLAFVGDNLAKAQMQSLVCLLSQVEKPSLVYDNKDNQSMSWHFNTSDISISMVWSPYLVQGIDENGYKKLRLDKLDTKWAVMVPTLDVLVLGVGSLFIEPTIYTVKDEAVGCYNCKDLHAQNNITELSMYSGFRATMRSTIMGVGALPGFEGITLFLQPFGFIKGGKGSHHSMSMKMKKIQEEELYQAYKRGSISDQSKMEVLHTNLFSMNGHDPLLQGSKNPTCLVHSPLTHTWNQFLQHTLMRLSNHSSYI